jgi:sulfite oxidase
MESAMTRSLSRRDWLRLSAAAAGHAAFGSQSWSAERPTGKQSLVVRSENPYNAEPPLDKLVAAAVTPLEQFYVRNHGPTPKVDAAELRLRIEGMIRKPVELALDELRGRFADEEVAATLTCAGNRRREMSEIRAVPGVQWDAGAIGHARWTGIALWRVLDMAELDAGAKHVWFEGLDPIQEKDGSVAPFGGSIPLERARDKRQPAILAHAMNGRPLAPEHGFPLRTVVPGYIGARSVKWLTKIVVSNRPSPNHYVAEAYKVVATDSKEELAKTEPIYDFPINAAICSPAAGAALPAGETTFRGYCLPPGDGKTTIAKVELSPDGGRTWLPARLEGEAAANCWQLWSAKVMLAAGDHELVVRATDSAGRVQPERCEWNLKGYLFNAWHRCPVKAA